MEDPDDNETSISADVGEAGDLAKLAWDDLDYDPDDLVGDLRSTNDPQLVGLSEEIEAARARPAGTMRSLPLDRSRCQWRAGRLRPHPADRVGCCGFRRR